MQCKESAAGKKWTYILHSIACVTMKFLKMPGITCMTGKIFMYVSG